MSIIPYLNSANNATLVSNEYLRLIRDHRNIILSNIVPTILDDKEMGFYRHRFHAFLLDRHIGFDYHLAIMLLNNFQSEFDFGRSKSKHNIHDITTVYIPLIETLDEYAKKIQVKSGT